MSYVKGVETRASGRMQLGSVEHILFFSRKVNFFFHVFGIDDSRFHLILQGHFTLFGAK